MEFNITDYGFERTVWANIKLAKLCPGNDISKFTDVMSEPDTEKQLNIMIDVVLILNQAYNRKYKRLDPDFEGRELTRDELLDLDENTLSDVAMMALGQFKEDGKVTVEAEPKKEKAEANE